MTFKLNKEHIGKKGKLVIKNQFGATNVEVEIGYDDDRGFFLFHNNAALHNQQSPPHPNFSYGYSLSGYSEISGRTIKGFVGFKLDSSNILFKKTSNGDTIFRRVYKEENELIFVGTTQKDPTKCMEPNAVVQTMDIKYMLDHGWSYLVTEISAEKKAQSSMKKETSLPD